MKLWTARLELGPPQMGDVEPLYHALVASRVTDTMAWDGPANRDEFARLLGEWEHQHAELPQSFVIRSAEFHADCYGQPLGMISLKRGPFENRGTLSYWLDQSHQGRGLMTEALHSMVRWGFDDLQLSEIFAQVFVGNVPSRRVLEKCGLHFLATVPCAGQKRGQWVDKWQFSLTQSQWLAQQSSTEDWRPLRPFAAPLTLSDFTAATY